MVPGHGGCRADSSLATSRSTAASHSPTPKPATTKPSADSPSNLLTHQDHPSLGLVTRSGAWGRLGPNASGAQPARREPIHVSRLRSSTDGGGLARSGRQRRRPEPLAG